MNSEPTAFDNSNRIATDIEECPKCDSENLEHIDSGSASYEGCLDWHQWKCKECAHVFTADA